MSPRALGWALAALTTLLVLVNQRDVGIARDEVVYMQAGTRYIDWWTQLFAPRPDRPFPLGRAGITRTFGGPNATDGNREHPPLVKTLSGISYRLLHDGLGIDATTAYRVPGAALHGVLVLLVYLMTLALWGRAAAVLAGLFVMVLPRALFHAGLACFDAPITTLWFATLYYYGRGLDPRGGFPWRAGVAFGLALATKHTAVLLPFALGAHYAIAGIRARGWRGGLLWRWPMIAALAGGPLVLLVLWPWLWIDPLGHTWEWLAFHLDHVHYNFEYLGVNWNAPPFPWHVAVVTTLFTVPVVTLAGAAIGAAAWVRRRRELPDRERMPGLLLALSAAASVGPFLLGTTPIFGAEKHWMPMLPSLCIAAGVGVAWAARALGQARVLCVAMCAIVVAAAAVETWSSRPYALTWYNALAGGAPGGADLGMNRQFWGVAARGVLPELRADAGATRHFVYSHDASPAWPLYIRDGRIPPTLPDAGPEASGIAKSDYALVIHERHFNRHDFLIWKAYGTVRPWFVLRSDGVPIVSVYRRARVSGSSP